MSTLLADPPKDAPSEQQSAPGTPDDPQAPPASVRPTCANCGAPMDGTQDWCLQCGAGTSDSLSTRAPSWRSAAVVLSVVALLAAGAATAAYAALSKGNDKSPSSTTVARVAPPAATTPATSIPPPATPGATTAPPPTVTAKVGAPTTIQPSTTVGTSKPPKIPLAAVTPTVGATAAPTTPKQTAPNASPGDEGAGNAPQPILLDTNAAATYNPYGYPAGNFGDPSLAIDGDTSTGWTAQVDPAVAPKMAEGLAIDLNTPRKLSALALSTSTPGMTVQVYGANGKTPPTSITDPAWVALSPSLLAKKRHTRIAFGGSSSASKQAAKQPHRFVVLWISGAPASSVGTAQAPGHVSVNELELFPAKK